MKKLHSLFFQRPGFLLLVTAVFILSLSWNSAPLAQSKTGTTIGQFLLIEPSARGAAMGNAAVASTEEVLSTYYNPGALGTFTRHSVQFTHSLWLADITYDCIAGALHMGNAGNLLLNATMLNSGEIAVRTVEHPLGTGEHFSVSNFSLGLGYGRQLTDRFAVGLQINYIQETIWHSSLATVALNVGTIYRLSPQGPRLGAAIVNFGLPARYSGRDLRIVYDKDAEKYGDNSNLPGMVYSEAYPLPVLFRVGIDWPMRLGHRHEIHLAVNAFHPSDNEESLSLGAEWVIMKTLALRAGYQNLSLHKRYRNESETGLTLGTGVAFEVGGSEFRLDYGWADYGRLENAQRFTLGLQF